MTRDLATLHRHRVRLADERRTAPPCACCGLPLTYSFICNWWSCVCGHAVGLERLYRLSWWRRLMWRWGGNAA